MLASQNPREGCSPARSTAATAVAAGSSPTITALCAEVRSWSARALKSGQPRTTPSATSASRASCGRDGPRRARREQDQRGRHRRDRLAADADEDGSSSSTATRVAGSVKLKASTPRKPRKTGTRECLGDAVEPADDRRRVAHEGAGSNTASRSSSGAASAIRSRNSVPLVPGALRRLLDDPVGVVARAPGLDQREQRPLRVERAVRGLEVRAHPLLVNGHPLDHADRQVLRVVEQDRRVGQRHALDGGVRDVALVPERHVLEPGLRVAAQQPRDPGDPLA